MRILHTMLRVGNLDVSIAFYTEVLGMRLLRRKDYPEGKFTLAFVGYDDESVSAAIELTHNWGVDSYERGNAFGHILFDLLPDPGCCGSRYFCHVLKSLNWMRLPGHVYFVGAVAGAEAAPALRWMALRGPLRVRALVRVR